jgi:hypothetical protein
MKSERESLPPAVSSQALYFPRDFGLGDSGARSLLNRLGDIPFQSMIAIAGLCQLCWLDTQL